MYDLINFDVIYRFRKFYTEGGGCWEWFGAKDKKGYGRFGIGRKTYLATRVMYCITHKGINDSLDVMHTCDNPSCVKPEHLTQGTRLENMKDARDKDRVGFGSGHYSTKLTDEDVLAIRDFARCGMSQRRLAEKYHLSRWAIEEIIHYRNWKHLP